MFAATIGLVQQVILGRRGNCRLALHEVTRGFRAQPPSLADTTFLSRILMGSVFAARMILEAIANTTSF